MRENQLKVLFVSSEVSPFVKTGGLGDVAGALPYALKKSGIDIRVVMPKYKSIPAEFTKDFKSKADFPVFLDWRKHKASIYEYNKDLPVYFIGNDYYFDREDLYSYEDDHERFAFFCKAVLKMLIRIDFIPDIIHCNDWQTGPIPLLLKENYHDDSFYNSILTLFTIHNLQYQGIFGKESLRILGVPDWYFNPEHIEFYGNINYMKAGLQYSDAISTVSKTYAREIMTKEYGYGLEGILQKRSQKLYGIVNGIDYKLYNPESDDSLYVKYSPDKIELKEENKKALQKELNLPQKDVPLISIISRLVEQKGFDLIAEQMDELMKEDIQMIILGTGEERYERLFSHMEERFPEKVRAKIYFDLDLAQKIYGGSDLFLMPSLFEPCGLGQLISLRYGTIPVVRHTGGLADTIEEFNKETASGNGFVFNEYNSYAMLAAIRRAIAAYHDKESWKKLIRNAMASNHSWEDSAKEYLNLYKELASK
ncbi:MAG: glycogen synthase GlgA [Epulopiscium sp.]|jgi:starch synthase|nr:glycogen synthase GlgA [Candidatus Epulonipiscium sp.]HOQ17841.1 glycogen synthase GlgA [Defluviitaleaceae bacterium]HPT75892.1 glycogen synthase GlgA [Defluviitaleaceae bacterium]